MKTAYVARLACHAGIACVVAVTFLLLGGSVNLSRTAYADGGALTAGTAGSNAAGASQAGGYTEVAKVTLNKTSGLIKNNGKLKLKATLVGADPSLPVKNATVTWKVSKPKLASVTEDGIVQGKKSGTVKVTATASNGAKATAKIKVVVNAKQMATKIPVLTYHRIASDYAKRHIYDDTNLAISRSLFQKQMSWLKKNGYHTVSTTEFADWRIDGAFLPKKSVLITIDDGFYETYRIAYPILRKLNLKATSFVIGSNVPKKTAKYNSKVWWNRYLGRDAIKKVRSEYPNLEFQSHTYNMHYRSGGVGIAKFLSRKKIDADFAKNKKFGFTCIAYPFGHTSKNLLASVKANKSMRLGFGYMMDYPASRTSPIYNVPRFKVFGDRGLGDFKRIVRTAS